MGNFAEVAKKIYFSLSCRLIGPLLKYELCFIRPNVFLQLKGNLSLYFVCKTKIPCSNNSPCVCCARLSCEMPKIRSQNWWIRTLQHFVRPVRKQTQVLKRSWGERNKNGQWTTNHLYFWPEVNLFCGLRSADLQLFLNESFSARKTRCTSQLDACLWFHLLWLHHPKYRSNCNIWAISSSCKALFLQAKTIVPLDAVTRDLSVTEQWRKMLSQCSFCCVTATVSSTVVWTISVSSVVHFGFRVADWSSA